MLEVEAAGEAWLVASAEAVEVSVEEAPDGNVSVLRVLVLGVSVDVAPDGKVSVLIEVAT